MRTIIVHFDPQQDEQALLIHRLRNFGEDVDRQLRKVDWGHVSLAEIDAATSYFSITDVHANKLRRLTTWLQKEAELQNLQIAMSISDAR